MSQPHTHAPGEPCNHIHHAPATPLPALDRVSQAIIDADFNPVNLDLNADNTQIVCSPHKLEKCAQCHLDFVSTNRLAKLFVINPTLRCTPPSNVISLNLSKAITTTKEEGNVFFKLNRHADAISRYTMAANIAIQRPPWEANQHLREELSTVICNRSAAYFESGDFISAIVDADTVIRLRRNWSKGHFRKAKALLALGRWQDAKDSVRLGLQFEPDNKQLIEFLSEIEKAEAHAKEAVTSKIAASSVEEKEARPDPTPSKPSP